MIVLDEAAWQEQLAALEGDETGREVRKFLESWVDAAEEIMGALGPAEAIRRALTITERKLGLCSAHIIGQMLAMIVLHWGHSGQLVEEFTTIEYRLVTDALLVKMEELNKQAEEVP